MAAASAASAGGAARPAGVLFTRSDTDFVDRFPGGGFDFKLSKKELSEQRAVSWELIKEAGRCLIEGKELVSISMPVKLFEPRSFLQRLAAGWVYAPVLLSHAASLSDPLERFKLVVAFAVSSLHLTVTSSKPFNPILGETLQASLDDGTQIFMEQTSHHPPCSSWEVFGPNGAYKFFGSGVWSAHCVGNTVKGNQKGPSVIEFADGQRVSFTVPQVHVHGIMFGDRYCDFHGTMVVVDEKNDLYCELTFAPDSVGFFKGLFKKPKTPSDTVRGDITRGSGKGAPVLASVGGSWLAYLDIDSHRYWDVRDCAKHTVVPDGAPLQSDSRFREDLVALLAGDLTRAAEYKRLLEEKQRYDRKLRSAAATRRVENAKKAKKAAKKAAKLAGKTPSSASTPLSSAANSAPASVVQI